MYMANAPKSNAIHIITFNVVHLVMWENVRSLWSRHLCILEMAPVREWKKRDHVGYKRYPL